MTSDGHDRDYLKSLLLALQQKTLGRSVSMGEIFHFLSGRARPLLPIILSLPFCQPIQIPGMSTPFGLMIAFLGLRIAFAKNIWLPQKVLSLKISEKILQTILEKALWITCKCQRGVYPRIVWLTQGRLSHLMHGLTLFTLGLVLALPLPIPLSNLMAAWSILFIGLGLLELDGLMILVGYTLYLLMLLLFASIIFSLTQTLCS